MRKILFHTKAVAKLIWLYIAYATLMMLIAISDLFDKNKKQR